MKSKHSNLLSLFLCILCAQAQSSAINNEKDQPKELKDLNQFPINRKNNGIFDAAATAENIKDLSSTAFFAHNDHDHGILLDSSEVNLKYDVEILESGDLKKETEVYEEQFRGPAALNMDTNNFSNEDIEVHAVPRPEKVSYFALLTAMSIFVMIALVIYVILITWRRNLEQRYGARILVGTNCDDEDYVHQINRSANAAPIRQLPLNPV